MSNAGKKLIEAAQEAAQEAVKVAKCDHDYVEGAEVNGNQVLRCMICKATVHIYRDLSLSRRK